MWGRKEEKGKKEKRDKKRMSKLGTFEVTVIVTVPTYLGSYVLSSRRFLTNRWS